MARLIDDDPQREQRRQDRLMAQIERQFEPRYRDEIARAMLAYAEAWEATGAIDRQAEHMATLETITRQQATEAIRVFGNRLLNAPKSGPMPEHQKDFAATLLKFATMFIAAESFRRRISQIAETTRNQIIAAVEQGFNAGLGQDGTGKLIRDLVPVMSRQRANLIARTETHNAANYGAVQAAKETGLALRKEWIAAIDERTRFQHAALSGKVVGQDETWMAPAIRNDPAYQIAFPGDPNAPAHGTINCRCAISWVTDD